MPSPAMTAMRCFFMDQPGLENEIRAVLLDQFANACAGKSRRSPYRTAAQTSKYLWRPALLQHDVELALFLLRGQLLLLLVGKHVRLAPFVGQQEFLVFDHLAGRVDGPFEIVAVVDGVGQIGRASCREVWW